MSQEISLAKKNAEKFSEKKYLPNELWREISSKKSLKRKYLPKTFWRTFSTKKSLQRNPYPKSQISDWVTLEPKKLWRGISSKRSLKIKFWRKKQWREITSQKSLQEEGEQSQNGAFKEEGEQSQNGAFKQEGEQSQNGAFKQEGEQSQNGAFKEDGEFSTADVDARDEICLPEILWREISTKHLSKETPSKKAWKTSTKNMFEEKSLSKKTEDNILPKYIRRKNMYQTRCEGQLSSKQNLNRNLFQTNSKKNLYQRIFEKTRLPKNP